MTVRQEVPVLRVGFCERRSSTSGGSGAPTAAGAGPAYLLLQRTCRQRPRNQGVLCRDRGKRQVTVGCNNIPSELLQAGWAAGMTVWTPLRPYLTLRLPAESSQSILRFAPVRCGRLSFW